MNMRLYNDLDFDASEILDSDNEIFYFDDESTIYRSELLEEYEAETERQNNKPSFDTWLKQRYN